MNPLKPYFIIIKSLLFYLFDSLALWKTPAPQKNQLELVLLIRQDAIGDFVMWLDTAKEYRKLYPSENYRIVLAGNAVWFDLAKGLPYWDEVLPINVKNFKTFSTYRRDILRQVRNLGAQIAVQPTFSREFYHGDSLVRASNAFHKVSSVGDMSNRNWLKKTLADGWHTELIPASTQIMTELERNAEFFQGLSRKLYQANYPKLKLSCTAASTNLKTKDYYVLFPGVSTALRKWPAENFAEIANRIFDRTGLKGILDGAPNEKPLAVSVQNLSRASLEWEGTSLDEFPELLKNARFLISVETSSAHIASAVCTPTICILGGGHFGRFVPYPDLPGQINYLRPVFHKMPCYGCNWECIYPLKEDEPAPCVSNISVDAVWQEVEKIIETKV
ncbi:MAG: glycosyltransferase family 9 protein, partial [SAR324 cluster bacterium]|nr:glycosyltransferase family 9 protein [SAR324 cluster bacterium]